MVSISLNKSNPTFVLLFGLPCPALLWTPPKDSSCPWSLGGKGIQL